MSSTLVSIIIPLYNEAKMIDMMYTRCTKVFEAGFENYEIICVNDGSQDETLNKLKTYYKQDPRINVLSLSRNFGHQPAVFAGLAHARGEYIAVMDADLQDPPEHIPEMYKKAREGWDVVYGVRKKRKENFLKRSAYSIFYHLFKAISVTKMPLDSGDFCLMHSKVVKHLLNMNEREPFLRGLRAWVGFQQTPYEYERQSRQSGKSKYSWRMLGGLAYKGLFGFSHIPIKLFFNLGIFLLVFSFLYLIYIFSKRLIWGEVIEGFTTLFFFIFLFSGVQLIGLGILGEYVTRIYDDVRQRPLYIVQESLLHSKNAE